jgi:hypothetical protein
MAQNYKNDLPHLILNNSGNSESYSSPNSAFAGKKYPSRPNRKSHAKKLLTELHQVNTALRAEMTTQPQKGGSYVEIIGLPGFDLKTESLENKRKGITLLNVRELPDKEKAATVFIPSKDLNYFVNKIEDYKEGPGPNKKNAPNNDLARSIEKFQTVSFLSFYTDDILLLPSDSQTKIWWEIWIKKSEDNRTKYFSFLSQNKIKHGNSYLDFTDLTIVLIESSIEMLVQQIQIFGFIAEIRIAKDVVVEFVDMNNIDQRDWSDELLRISQVPSADSPFVCLLDTGVNGAHSLLQPALAATDVHSVIVGQNGNDTHGHGTTMAGLAVWGQLDRALLARGTVEMPIRLESVKVRTNVPNNLPLYGNLTQEAVARAAATNPNVNRVVCLPISFPPYAHRGSPSSWSAAIDDICFGKVTGDKMLVVVAAGNIVNDPTDYPNEALTSSIHDPGQSWNALTVGYFANKDQITDQAFAGWTPLAPLGSLGPTSSTSLTWQRNKWPVKPDVVFEGGNFGFNPANNTSDTPPSLQMLTLHHRFPHEHFNLTMETSAATALLSRFAAIIFKTYPFLWPEMVRALIVHSASWTDEMLKLTNLTSKGGRESLLRTVGYGIPDLNKALKSATNDLNLLIHDEIFPFTEKGKMNELRMHKLPWPKQALESLGTLDIQMRVTLSYFIEPDPSSRGWDYKYQYSSYGLRFEVQKSEEPIGDFRARVNAASREENDDSTHESDTDWYFGKKIRSKGSVHSDYWEGTAEDLATRDHIAVYPTSGWWKIKDFKNNANRSARYALIVSISTPGQDTDIYNIVKNEIVIPIEV